MFGNNRNQLRQFFFDCWQLKETGQALDAMQKVVTAIIEFHPEYQPLLKNKDAVDKDFSVEQGETNPFLHMGMHIALHEQLSTDRPAGIKDIYQKLCQQQGDGHDAEHLMMDCLGEALWQAQCDQSAPDETAYLLCLQKLVKK